MRLFFTCEFVVPNIVAQAQFRRRGFGFANAHFATLVQEFLNKRVIGGFFFNMFHAKKRTRCTPARQLAARKKSPVQLTGLLSFHSAASGAAGGSDAVGASVAAASGFGLGLRRARGFGFGLGWLSGVSTRLLCSS